MLNEKLLILLLFRHEICQKIYTAGFSGQKFYIFKNTKKMSENGDIYTASKTFTLPPVVTNLTSAVHGVTWVTEASLIEKKPEKVLMGKIRQYLDGPNYSTIYIGIYATV